MMVYRSDFTHVYLYTGNVCGEEICRYHDINQSYYGSNDLGNNASIVKHIDQDVKISNKSVLLQHSLDAAYFLKR